MRDFRAEDYLNRKTLILGEINTGKTTLTKKVLDSMCAMGFGERIAILDMAPQIPKEPESKAGLTGVGGKLTPPEGCGVLYMGGRFDPPRLSSKTPEEALEKARQNMLAIDGLLRQLDYESRDILFINDASMYLQAGRVEDLVNRLEAAATAVVNGYWGERLGGGTISKRERLEMARLKLYFEEKGEVLIL
jgi:hypothetical protein